MAHDIQPKETQYRFIKFRSKSEAMFARALDLAGYEGLWTYEPTNEIPGSCDWSPDFAVGYQQYTLIEYKPSEPSEAYVNWWEREARKCTQANLCLLIWGSWYPKFNGFHDYFVEPQTKKNAAKVDLFLERFHQTAAQASRYRFDLM